MRFKTYKSIFNDYKNFFNSQLLQSNLKEPMDYLLKRGLKINIIKEFQLGFVPYKNNFYEELLKNFRKISDKLVLRLYKKYEILKKKVLKKIVRIRVRH